MYIDFVMEFLKNAAKPDYLCKITLIFVFPDFGITAARIWHRRHGSLPPAAVFGVGCGIIREIRYFSRLICDSKPGNACKALFIKIIALFMNNAG